jgi:hypothetical protein
MATMGVRVPRDLFAHGPDQKTAVHVRGRGQALFAGPDDARGGEPVHDRHLQVHEDQVVGVPADHGQHVQAVAGLVHGVPHLAEQQSGQFPVGGHVVDEQDFQGPQPGQGPCSVGWLSGR